MKKTPKQIKKRDIDLEKAYRKYLTPISKQEWDNTKSLEQPNSLKQVPTKSSSSSGDK